MESNDIPIKAYKLLSTTFPSIFLELQCELDIPEIENPSPKILQDGDLEEVLRNLISELKIEKEWRVKKKEFDDLNKKNEEIRQQNNDRIEWTRKNYFNYFINACDAVSSGRQDQFLEIVRDKLKKELVLIELKIASKS